MGRLAGRDAIGQVIIADTSVWINYFNGVQDRETDLLDKLLASHLILMGDLILTETLQGFRKDQDYQLAESALMRLPCAEMIGRETAVISAGNYRKLRKQGITVRKTIDVLIATFCIRNGHTLLHNDRDFDAMIDLLDLDVY